MPPPIPTGAPPSVDTPPLDLRVRSARDRLLDLIGIGETAPLQDMPARVRPPVVVFDGTAEVLIEPSEPGVAYDLRDKDGAPRPGAAPPMESDGAALAFPLVRIEAETSFLVLARKLPGPALPPNSGREAWLHARPKVAVGLATGLEVSARPTGATQPSRRPMLINHGGTIEVLVGASQEGVDYRLIDAPPAQPFDPASVTLLDTEPVLSAGGWTRGNGGAITLASTALGADTLVRVRCLKQFDDGSRTTQVLTQAIPVLVRANAELVPVLMPDNPIAFGSAPVLRIDPAEPGVAYRLYSRPLREAEFRPGATEPGLRHVPVGGGMPDVVLSLPAAAPSIWPDPPDFTPAPGEASGTGGGRIDLLLPMLVDDVVVVIEARKTHDPAVSGGAITSRIGLLAMPVLLVAPDPKPALSLAVGLAGDGTAGTTGPITVAGGQPGVAYTMRVLPAGPDLALPAYVPRRDEIDPRLNKGLGQVWIGIDFVVTDDAPDLSQPTASRPPPPPRLDAPALAFGTGLGLTAVKARTRIGVPLALSARIDAPPAIALTQPVGGLERVVVRASRPAEAYTISSGGVATAPIQGTGSDLELAAPPLGTDRRLTVTVRQADPALLSLELVLTLTVGAV